jgi:Ca2+-binding EF-hand superfamily protein
MMPRGLMMMDSNHDGKVSKEEWMKFYERRFTELDKNGDGFIEPNEWIPVRPMRGMYGRGPRP